MQNLITNNKELKHSILTILQGTYNGLYFGTKVRFMHTLSMTLLFRPDSLLKVFKIILNSSYEHGTRLAKFVFIYKSIVCLLNKLRNKKSKYHSLVAGFIGGFIVFKQKTPISYSIVLYLLARNVIGGAGNLQKRNVLPQMKFYPYLAAITWGCVMFLYNYDPTVLQSSLSGSMKFLYDKSNEPLESWQDLIPFELPRTLVLILKQMIHIFV